MGEESIPASASEAEAEASEAEAEAGEAEAGAKRNAVAASRNLSRLSYRKKLSRWAELYRQVLVICMIDLTALLHRLRPWFIPRTNHSFQKSQLKI